MTRSPRWPWWFWTIFAGVHYWYVTVPAAIALLAIGWHGVDWLGGLRFVAFAAGALLALPLPAAGLIYLIQSLVAATYWRTLKHDEMIAGVRLPAGSRAHFADDAHSDLISVDLPHTTEILGIRLAGRLTHYDTWDDVGPVWSGTLAEDQSVNGIPCRAGYFTFDKFGTIFDTHGTVHRFGLAATHDVFGLQFPQGTTVNRGNASRPWHFRLPADMGVYIPSLKATAPPGVTLAIANDGRLEDIDSGHDQTIIVCGLPLNSRNFRVQGGQVTSELAEPFFVAGAMHPAGVGIMIDLPAGQVSLLQ